MLSGPAVSISISSCCRPTLAVIPCSKAGRIFPLHVPTPSPPRARARDLSCDQANLTLPWFSADPSAGSLSNLWQHMWLFSPGLGAGGCPCHAQLHEGFSSRMPLKELPCLQTGGDIFSAELERPPRSCSKGESAEIAVPAAGMTHGRGWSPVVSAWAAINGPPLELPWIQWHDLPRWDISASSWERGNPKISSCREAKGNK